jgi:hypothetical protein
VKDAREKALAMMMVLAIAVAFLGLDASGVVKPLKEGKVAGCDGQIVRLDGKEGELLRLHNEERAKHGAATLC